MDSLVSIYKNMEDASGVNMFVSQNKPSPSGKQKHVGDASIEKANDKKHQGYIQEERVLKNQGNRSVESAEKLKDYTEKTVIRLNEHPSLNKEDNLAPFFWLRYEEHGESLSDQLLDVTPFDVLSFSDLKDSDHESPSKVST